MKKHILILCIALSAACAGAQGFITYLSGINEVPPNASPNWGDGTFTLTGNELQYGLFHLYTHGLGADIHGPAPAGSLAPVLFNLSPTGYIGPYVETNGNLDPGGWTFSGNVTLTPSQIADLNAGLLYINLRTPDFPDGELRGQITLVPEPSTWALLVSGGFLFWLCGRKKRMA